MARNNADLDTRLARRPSTGRPHPQRPGAETWSWSRLIKSARSTASTAARSSTASTRAASIRELGPLEPVVVTRVDVPVAGYELVAGHRRLAALRIAGKTEAPCGLRDGGGPAARARG
jgi:hypothetical protein